MNAKTPRTPRSEEKNSIHPPPSNLGVLGDLAFITSNSDRMPHAKHKDDPTPPALLTYLDELVEHLRRLIPTAIRGSDADAIHDARVATRRLKAALDLLQTAIDHRRLRPFAKT